MRAMTGGRVREADTVSARKRLLRRVLTVTGVAGAFVGAGLIASSAAQAADRPAGPDGAVHSFVRPDDSQRDSSRGGLLANVGTSVGAVLDAGKPTKPVRQLLAGEPDAAAGGVGHHSVPRADAKSAVPQAPASPSARHPDGRDLAASPSHKRAAPVKNETLLGRLAVPVTERAGETAKPVTAGLGKAADPVTAPVGRIVGHLVAPVTEPVGQALAPVTRAVAPVTDQLAPVAAPAAQALAPLTGVLEPVTAPVLRPVTRGLDPVTEPVTSGAGLSPVTSSVGLTPAAGAQAPGSPGGPSDPTPSTPARKAPDVPAASAHAAAPAASARPAAPAGRAGVGASCCPTVPVASRADWAGQASSRGIGAFEEAGGPGWSGDSDLPVHRHQAPVGTTGAGSPSSSLTGSAGPGGALADSAAATDVSKRGSLASTAWDVIVGGLVYDGRGPRIPG